MFVGSWAMMGGKKTETSKGPPLNASSKDEENFIQYVLVYRRSHKKLRGAGLEEEKTDTIIQRIHEEQ